MELCLKCDRKHDFDVIVGYVVACRKLRWTCLKHSNDVGWQVKTPCKATFCCATWICCHVAGYILWQWYTQVLQYTHFLFYYLWSVATCHIVCCFRPVYYKTLIPWKSMFFCFLNIKMTWWTLSNFHRASYSPFSTKVWQWSWCHFYVQNVIEYRC